MPKIPTRFLLLVAFLSACGPARRRAVGHWSDSDHDFEMRLERDGTGDGEFSGESRNARYALSWHKSKGKFVIEFYCREVFDEGAECGDDGYEDFELECEHIKEDEPTENRDGEEMHCTGPEGDYFFIAVI